MDIEKLIEQITDEVRKKIGTPGWSGASSVDSGISARSANNDIAALIDHTTLKPDSTEAQVIAFCRETKEHRFASVCVLPSFVSKAAECLRGSGINVGTVAGFPYGATSTAAKVAEVREAVMNGAKEIDVAMNFAAIKSDRLDEAKRDFDAVVGAARGNAIVKAIVEFPLLSPEERVKALTIAKLAGADFIKISHATGSGKCSPEDVVFVRRVVGPSVGIKADGGIKDAQTARALMQAGANRLGASGSVAIVTGKSSGSACAAGSKITVYDLAKMIDHSLLHPTMTDAILTKECEVARKYDVATVCIKPYAVPLAARILAGSNVKVCAVAGFPHGNSHTDIIIAETIRACKEGATEIDIVSNTGKVLGGDWNYVSDELKAVNDAVTARGAILKVIFENDFIKEEHIVRLCEICSRHDIAFVKTSTGYGFVKQPDGAYNYKGATEPHLKLMREHSKPSVQVKAAGGVRTLADLVRVRELGITRIGATATAAILDEAAQRIAKGEDLAALGGKPLGGGGY